MDFSNLGTVLMEAWPLLWEGLQTTVFVTVVSLVVAMLLGILTCLMNLSKIAPLRGVAKFYIWIIRGTPMLVQAFYLYFAVPQLLQATIAPDFRLDVITASIITLILNAGAYIAEIFRGAIQSVDKGQMEASRSLGVGHATTMRKIILPQAVRICLPSLPAQPCQPVHHHAQGLHDHVRHRPAGDHEPLQGLRRPHDGIVCHLHLGRHHLPRDHQRADARLVPA